jgi:hypothetical protein
MQVETINGYTVISQRVNGTLYRCKYQGYKLADCKRLFKSHLINELRNN